MPMPTKFTPEVRACVLDMLTAGSQVSTAALVAGISKYTLFHWLAAKDPKFTSFQADVREAREQGRLAPPSLKWEMNPYFWLLCGPGRETYHEDGTVARPGWAKPGRREHVRQTALERLAAEERSQPLKKQDGPAIPAPKSTDPRANDVSQTTDSEPVVAQAAPKSTDPTAVGMRQRAWIGAVVARAAPKSTHPTAESVGRHSTLWHVRPAGAKSTQSATIAVASAGQRPVTFAPTGALGWDARPSMYSRSSLTAFATPGQLESG